MTTEKVWKFVERFKIVLELIVALIVAAPVLIALLQQGLAAVVPVWLVILTAIFAVMLGFLLGRRPKTAYLRTAPELDEAPLEIVAFNYPDSPINHGWEIWESKDKTQPTLKRVSDGFFGNALEVRSNTRYAMDYTVSPVAQTGTLVEFTAKVEQGYGLYALVSVQSKDGMKTENVWFNFQVGLAQPQPYGDGSGEWTIFLTPKQIGGNWLLFRGDLKDILTRTVGKNGWGLRKLRGFRIRGNLSLAHIKVYQK
jgi:hypothetical protein